MIYLATSKRRIFLCKGEQCYIIKSNVHTYNIHLMKANKDMEVHKSLVKTWHPNPQKKRSSTPKTKTKKPNSQTSLDLG